MKATLLRFFSLLCVLCIGVSDAWGEESIYTRSITPGNYGTICMPFNAELGPEAGAIFYQIKSKTANGKGILLVEEKEFLEAGKPYLFKAISSTLSLIPGNEVVASPVAAVGLVGNLSAEILYVPQGCYILRNNQICMVAEEGAAAIGQYRAYIDFASIPDYNTGGQPGLDITVEDETSIDKVEAAGTPSTECYDLLGRKVRQMKRGQLYILNGKKFFNQ